MKVQQVIERVLNDPEYASELIAKVGALTQTGKVRRLEDDDAWKDVLSHFADGPEELAKLSTVDPEMAGSSWWTTTVTTVTTTTTTPTAPITVTTMTTMTTATVAQ